MNLLPDFAKNIKGAADCEDGRALAYTLGDPLNEREKIYFCDILWEKGGAGNVDCDSLDLYPSEKMDAFSRVVLHEMTHYSLVGPEISQEV